MTESLSLAPMAPPALIGFLALIGAGLSVLALVRGGRADTEEHTKWREHGDRIHNLAEVIIGKQRHGPTGTVRLQFTPEYTKFNNLDSNDQLPDAVF